MNLSRFSLSSAWARLRADRKGISAVEFALIAPVIVVFYFGCIEISTMLLTDRKVTNTSASMADLVARRATMDTAEMTNVFNSSVITMAPNDISTVRLRVSSIIFDDDGTTPIVDWSRANTNWTARADGSTVTVPIGMIPDDGSVILSEVEYDYSSITGLYDPDTGFMVDVSQVLTEQSWMRPRRVDTIPFS